MSDQSPRLSLPYIQPAQAQKHVTHNEALLQLDVLVQLVVEAFGATTPPGSPSEGAVWALGASPSGAWSGQGGALACWQDGAWRFIFPKLGWRAACGIELRLWDGSTWVVLDSVDLDDLPFLGINATADTSNRLALSSGQSLFNHAGHGHKLQLNKAASTDTAVIALQTAGVGRAEIGTLGSDHLGVRVSADGSSWHHALQVTASTGGVHFPANVSFGAGVSGAALAALPALHSASSTLTSTTTSHDRAALATMTSTIGASLSAVIASSGVTLSTGEGVAVLASANASVTSGTVNQSAVIACGNATAGVELAASNAVVIGSRRVVNAVSRSLAMGTAASGAALASNRTLHLLADSGTIQLSGTVSSSHSFADFAEMFAHENEGEIGFGVIVTEIGGKIRPAHVGDEILGVVSATPIIIAGDTPFTWQGRWLVDEWGQRLYDALPDPDYEGTEPAPLVRHWRENPLWDPEAEQIPRSARPREWSAVGLLGQVLVRVAADVVAGDRLRAKAGIGVKSRTRTGLRCMTIAQAFDAAKGYGVARALVNTRV